MSVNPAQLLEKLKALPPQRLAEVEDFIDFLGQRESERAITQAAQAISEPLLHDLWKNDTDAEYDRL